MNRRLVLWLTLTLLISVLSVAFNAQNAKASGTIYIRADGSVDPPTANITTVDGITYTFTSNMVFDSIVVERNDIVVDGAGYMLQGTGGLCGIDLTGRTNVTVRNAQIKNFDEGIRLDSSSSNSIIENNITANYYYGIRLNSSSGNSIIRNNIAGNLLTAFNQNGIYLNSSSNNSISGNSITANHLCGIHIDSSSNNNSISSNTIADNGYGTGLSSSSNNNILGNTFTNDGLAVWDLYQNVVENNTMNGKPLVYLENVADYTICDAGQVILVNCTRMRVENLSLSTASIGVQLLKTDSTIISRNNMTGKRGGVNDEGIGIGIQLDFSSNNNICENAIANKSIGVWLHSSSNNSVSSNNITYNTYYGVRFDSSFSNCISSNNITHANYGVRFDSSFSNSIIENNITEDSMYGVWFNSSSNNSISGNTIANSSYGIQLYFSSNNSISGNNIPANHMSGIWFNSSSNNSIIGNNIARNNWYGIVLGWDSSSNKVCHNNFVDNEVQADSSGLINAWDEGYPSGGNYWSNYDGTDLYHGAYQNETGSDGIGDVPRVIDVNNTDNYPLMKPFSSQTVDIGITRFAAERTVFWKDYVLRIDVDVVNYGVEDQTSNVTFSANSTGLGTVSNVLLVFRNATRVTFTWNTSGRDFGKYKLGAVMSPLPNETDTSDNVAEDLWVTITIVADVNGDYVVDIYDALVLSGVYGSLEGDSVWNPNANLHPAPDSATGKQTVDIFDAIVLSGHYGQGLP